jgi:TPR repeat protein
LKQSIKELSKDLDPVIMPVLSSNVLTELSESSSDNLSTQQIEELAKGYFEGSEDGKFERNLTKAVDLWLEGSRRGSLESTYSLATCYREGKGVEKDTQRAFQMLQNLAEEKNYSYAQVCIQTMKANKKMLNLSLRSMRSVLCT